MLAIRMQRTGRTGHTQFRVIVQDSHAHPKGGRVVAYVGSYNPHTKISTLDKEKISTYLSNGAQPSDRVARLLQKEGVKLPDWFKASPPKKKDVRNPEKRRSTAPEVPKEEAPVAQQPADEAKVEETADEPLAETNETSEPAVDEKPAEPSAEEPVETPPEEAGAQAPTEPETPD